jgi:hypothetical protein
VITTRAFTAFLVAGFVAGLIYTNGNRFIMSGKDTHVTGLDSVTTDANNGHAVLETPVVCNQFDVVADLQGTMLDIHLDTDLPDFTEIMVSVSRSYQEKGDNRSKYPIDYYSAKSTVGEWRTGHVVSVTDQVFHNALQNQLDEMAALAVPFEVAKIQDTIDVSFTVPLYQANSLFGPDNVNLKGEMVATTGARVIRNRTSMRKPLGSKSRLAARKESWLTLEVGRTYLLSSAIPLMPELEPRDPLTAISQIVNLPPETLIVVLGSRMRGSRPWYYVDTDSDGVGNGWINGGVLIRDGATKANSIGQASRSMLSTAAAGSAIDLNGYPFVVPDWWAQVETPDLPDQLENSRQVEEFCRHHFGADTGNPGTWQKALKTWVMALEQLGGIPVYVGHAYFYGGQFGEAANAYSDLFSLASDQGDKAEWYACYIAYNAGRSHALAGHYEEARSWFLKGASFLPSADGAIRYYATECKELGRIGDEELRERLIREYQKEILFEF